MMSQLFSVITQSAVVTSLMLSLVIILAVVECFSPHTFGLVGVLAAMTLATLIYAYQCAGQGLWFAPWLLLAGIGLVLFEALGIHLHGFAMVPGALLIGLGMYFALGASENAAIATTAGLAVTFCSAFCVFKLLPLSRFWIKSGAGNVLKVCAEPVIDHASVGVEGTAISDLRPRGIVILHGNRTPAIADSGYLRSGSPVIVIDVRKNEVVVASSIRN